MDIKVNTPKHIVDVPVSDVYKLVSDPECARGLPSPKVRLRIVRMVFDVLGYDLSPDLALALIAEPQAQLTIAPAGGGKTTGATIKVICEKIWRHAKDSDRPISGRNVLYLVYNKHNVKPMIDKHAELVSRLRLAKISGLDIDSDINASTMHAFCDLWRTEYVAQLQLVGYTLLQNDESDKLVQTIIDKVCVKYNEVPKPVARQLLALHNFAKETVTPLANLEHTDKFINVGLSLEIIEEICKAYENMKKLKRKYDFTDMLIGLYNLLHDNPDIRARVQHYYDYVVADEVQDFTPIMSKILKMLVSDGTPLMCIGDDDQSIYKFRGADVYGTLNFSEEFSGGEVYLLGKNRRCSAEVLKLATNVINENKLRFAKEIYGDKGGGNVSYIPYNSLTAENAHLTSFLTKQSDAFRDSSVICYRERVSSILMSEMLEDAKVPHRVLSGYSAFSHELYRHVIGVLNFIEAPRDTPKILNLYKCTPLKKKQVQEALKYDPKKGTFGLEDRVHFAQLDFGKAMNTRGLIQELEWLVQLSANISKLPMSSYFPMLFEKIKKYFWTYQKSQRGLPEEVDNYVEEKILKMFSVDRTYEEVFMDYSRRLSICRRNQKMGYGVTLATFHGLKGLEFDNVFILDMDNDIFPNFALIDSKDYNEESKQILKESETCLYYVAVTRSKNNLTIYYNESNPSRYVLLYNPAMQSAAQPATKTAQKEDTSKEGLQQMTSFADVTPKDSGALVDLFDPLAGEVMNISSSTEVIDLFDPMASDLVEITESVGSGVDTEVGTVTDSVTDYVALTPDAIEEPTMPSDDGTSELDNVEETPVTGQATFKPYFSALLGL